MPVTASALGTMGVTKRLDLGGLNRRFDQLAGCTSFKMDAGRKSGRRAFEPRTRRSGVRIPPDAMCPELCPPADVEVAQPEARGQRAPPTLGLADNTL
jgi:hypothetical protein